MITRRQREVLEEYLVKGKKFKGLSERNKFNKTLVRVQKHIDRGLQNLVWLSIKLPNILLDEERELEDESLEPHRRLKALLKVMSNVNPRFEVALVIKDDYSR